MHAPLGPSVASTACGKHRKQGERRMPFGMTNEPRERIEANNEVKLNGTYEFEIVDAWFYSVTEVTKTSPRTGKEYTARQYTADLTNDQDVQFKLRLVKRPDIVVSDTLRCYVGKKSRFAQLISSLIEVEPGDDLIKYLMAGKDVLDVKETSKLLRADLLGSRVLCTMLYNADTGYTRVKAYTATPQDEGDDLAAIPLQTNPGLQKAPMTDEQRASEADDDLSFDGLEVPF
jgi:hypothetical protein